MSGAGERHIGEDEQSADLVRRYIERNTVSGAGERWRVTGRTEGSNRVDVRSMHNRLIAVGVIQKDADRIVTDHNEAATLSYRLAASEARVRELEGALAVASGRLGYLSTVLSLSNKNHNAKGAAEWSREAEAALRGAEGNDTAERP